MGLCAPEDGFLPVPPTLFEAGLLTAAAAAAPLGAAATEALAFAAVPVLMGPFDDALFADVPFEDVPLVAAALLVAEVLVTGVALATVVFVLEDLVALFTAPPDAVRRRTGAGFGTRSPGYPTGTAAHSPAPGNTL